MNFDLTRNRINWLIKALVLAVAALLFTLAQPAARSASAQDEPERVAIGSDMLIAEGEVVQGDVSVTNGNLVLNGEVRGDVTIVNGNADIEGKVLGDVAITSGKVMLGPKSNVSGNVVAIMGEVARAPGAIVGGSVSDMHNPFWGTNGVNMVQLTDVTPWARNAAGRFAVMMVWGILSLVLLLLSALLVSIAPTRTHISADTLQAEVGPSLIVGVVTALLLPALVALVSLALMVTIVGTVLVPVVMLAALLALLFGLTVISLWMGRHMYASVQHNPETSAPLILQVLLGVPVVLICTVVPAALLPGWVSLLMLPLLYFAACIGLGGVILSRLGTLAPRSVAPRQQRL